jgi:primosomal replication protein N
MDKQKQDLESLPPGVAKGAMIVGVIVFLFFFIIIVSLLRSCSSSFSAPPPTTAPVTTTQPASTSIEVGDTITVTGFVSPTRADFDECTQLSIAKDYLGLGQMEANGQLYIVDAETKALVIGEGFTAYQVRIESGDYFGKSGWIIRESCKK